MTSWLCRASVCLSVLAAYGTAAHAQSPPSATQATLVALVDLPKVFEVHRSFKANMEAIQQQLKSVESQLEARQKSLAGRGKQLGELDPGSNDYKSLESDLARQAAEFQVRVRQTKKEFLVREARQYYASYQEILAAIERVSQKYNIGLVLRFDSRAIDPDDPRSVARGMSRSVVFQRNLDITELVVGELQIALAAKNNSRAPRR